MFHHSARALAGIAVAGLLLAGCTSDPDAASGTSASGSPSTSATTQASASASPSSTLTAQEQRAFEEAAEAVRKYGRRSTTSCPARSPT